MPEPKGSDVRTLAVRVSPDFHALLTTVAGVDEMSLTDLMMKALENHVASRREAPDFKAKVHLWPGVGLGASGAHHTSEIVAAFAHRADAPSQLWSGMLERARTNLDLLGYAMLFFPEQHPELARLLDDKCARGLRVRIALAGPDSEEVATRDRLEGLGGTLPGRIRTTVQHFEPILANPGVEVRYHEVPLYNALYRFDDQMLVTPYLYRLHGYQHPLLHLKRLGPAGIFESYAQQFEAIWAESQPILTPSGGPHGKAR